MSEGPRITLDVADRIVARLRERWSLHPDWVVVVGSVRRRRPEVGDIELIAPAVSPNAQDSLYERIAATIDNPPAPTSIFGEERPVAADAFATAERGLKPGFLACSLVVRAWGGKCTVPVQIYRYTPQNLGWMMIERTGPANFGRWFLMKWKHAHGIPVGDGRFKASIDNHLVNLDQKPVPVETEEIAFRRANMQWIPPEHRDVFIARAEAASKARRIA
ncbi:MAG TPA: hypothetical protein VK176_11625 [Phycisphaerales bacterium]|nr:hypothetical protein [Phycisphaerales bacterium]